MTQSQFTPEEMLGYRDQIVRNLQQELLLLDDLNQKGLFDKDEGIFTRKSYPEKVGVIQGEIQKLENFDVVLSVVGTMKAGKSTTINAIVGREILPNRNRPMTALPTLIYHNAEKTEPVLSFHNTAVVEFVQKLKNQLEKNAEWQKHHELSTEEMQELMKSIKNGWNFKEIYQGENEIFEFLAKLNDLVRLSEIVRQKSKDIQFPFEQCKEISQLPKIEVAFRHLVDMPANQGRLVLLDTPGPNEAGQAHLRTMLTEQLKRSSAVLLVLDYTQLKSEASASVKGQLEDVPNIQKDRLFALVNKFDQSNANSDDEEATKDIIFNDFLKDRIEREHIFPLSSYEAFLANRMAQELESNGKPAFDKEKWVADFAKLAFGRTANAQKWGKYTKEQIDEAIIDIINASKVQEPLDNAIRKTQLEAPRIAIKSALTQLRALLEDVHNFCNISLGLARKETEEEINKYEQMIKNVEQHIDKLNQLEKDTEKVISSFREGLHGELKKNIEKKRDKLKLELDSTVKSVMQDIRNNYYRAYGDSSYLKFSLTYTEYRKKQQLFYQAAAMNKLIDNKEHIVFSEESAVIEFYHLIQQLANGLLSDEISSLSDMYIQIIEIMNKQLDDVDEKVNNTLSEIEKEFSKEHIQVSLFKPNIDEELKLHDKDVELKTLFQKRKDIITVEQTGFWAGVKRFFGMNATEKVTKEYYEIEAIHLHEQLMELVEERISPIEIQIQELFDSFSDDWKNEYIGKITSRAEDLKNEAKNQLAELEQGKVDKESYKAEVEDLQQQTQKIRGEMADFNQLFGVAETNNKAA